MTLDDYKLAVWKLHRSAVPKDEVLDWLHEAVIEWYEQGEPQMDRGLGNWLGLVAWSKWKSYTKTTSYRRTVLCGDASFFADNKKQYVKEEFFSDELDGALKLLTKTQQKYAHLWGRGLSCAETSESLGISKQAISQCRKRIREYFQDGLPPSRTDDDVRDHPG